MFNAEVVEQMTIYIFLLTYWGSFSLILNQLFKSKKKYNNRIYIFIAGFSLFLLMSLRHFTVGTDLRSYYNEFLNAELFLSLRPSEIGYSYFNYFFYKVGFNFQMYLTVIAAIIVYAISKLYLIFSKNIMLSYYLFVTLGLFAITLTGLRQSLAIAITIFAFTNLMKNKKVLFFILVIIAYFFHNSAIAFLIIYPIRNIKINNKMGFMLYFMALASYFAINIFVPIVWRISPERFVRRYMILESNINPLVVIVYILIPLAILLVWKFDNRNKQFDAQITTMFIISLINMLVYFLATEIALFERVSLYFIVYNTILIPNVIETIRDREIKLLAKIICIVLPMIMFTISTPGGSAGIDNYKFFWK